MFRRSYRFETLEPAQMEDQLRGQIALAFDRQLREAARSDILLRRVLGRGLAQLADQSAFIKLGFSTLGSYVNEAVGIGARHGQDLAWMERSLRARPELSKAFDDGEITFSALRLLLRNTEPEHDRHWASIASGKTVHEVQALLDELDQMVAEYKPPADADVSHANDDGQVDPAYVPGDLQRGPASVPDEAQTNPTGGDGVNTKHAPLNDAVTAANDPSTVGESGYPLIAPEDDVEPPEGQWVVFSGTRALAARWYTALELAQRHAGADISVASCVEMFCAEFMNGEGAQAIDEARRQAARVNASASATAAGDASACDTQASDACSEPDTDESFESPWERHQREMKAYWKEVERDAGQATNHWSFLPHDLPTTELPSSLSISVEDDPFTVDRKLRDAARLTNMSGARLRRLLADFSLAELYEELDFVNLEHYVRERLSMSPSAVRTLMRLHYRLRHRPQISRALDAGALNQTQAELLARLNVCEEGERAWIAHARQTTVRFLKEDVQAAEWIRDHDPGTFFDTYGIPQARMSADSSDSRVRKRTDARALARWETLSAQARERIEMIVQQTCAPGDRASDGSQQTCAPGTSASDPSQQTCAPDDNPRAPLPLPIFRDELMKILEELAGEVDHYDPEQHVVTVRFWLPAELSELWNEACGAGRLLYGGHATTADCMELFLDAFLSTWGHEALDCIRKHPILERHGFKCAVPTCGRRAYLHVHHLHHRSQGGGNEKWMQVALCRVHHLQGVHMHRIRVTGKAPDNLLWELGLKPAGGSLLVVDDRRVISCV